MGTAARVTRTGRPVVARQTGPTVRRWEATLTLAAASIVASPVLFNPAGFDAFQLPKLVFQTIAVITGLTAIVVLRGPIWHRALVPLGCLLLALLISALLSGAPVVALAGTSSRRFGLVSWVLMAASFVIGMGMARTGSRVLLFKVLWVSSALVSVYAVAQRLGLDPFDAAGAGPALRPGSTLGSATFCGGYLALVVALGASALFSRWPRWPWLAPILLLDVVALLLTQSRGAWIGAAVGVLFAAAVSWRQNEGRHVFVILAIGVGVTAMTLFSVPGLISRASSLTEPTEGTAGGRIELALMGIGAVAERPVIGWGPDLSREPMHRQIGEDFERRFSDDRIEDRAHNAIIDVAIWVGLLGVLLLLWFVGEIVRSAWSVRSDWTAVALCAGLLAFGVHLLFNFPVPELDLVVWLLAGTLVPCVGVGRVRAPVYIAGMVAALLGVMVLVGSLDSLSADRHLRRAVDAENDGDLVAAGEQYGRSLAVSPGSTRLLEVQSRWLLRQGQPVAAVAVARRAVESDPTDPYLVELLAKSLSTAALSTADVATSVEAESLLRGLLAESPYDGSLHLELGTSLAAQGKLDEAADEYERAASILPLRSEPVRNLGLLAERRGELDAALEFFERAVELDPSDDVAISARDRLLSEVDGP